MASANRIMALGRKASIAGIVGVVIATSAVACSNEDASAPSTSDYAGYRSLMSQQAMVDHIEATDLRSLARKSDAVAAGRIENVAPLPDALSRLTGGSSGFAVLELADVQALYQKDGSAPITRVLLSVPDGVSAQEVESSLPENATIADFFVESTNLVPDPASLSSDEREALVGLYTPTVSESQAYNADDSVEFVASDHAPRYLLRHAGKPWSEYLAVLGQAPTG